MWKFEILALILGGFLIIVAVLGGGFELKELRIPSVSTTLRVVAGFLGLLFVALAVAVEAGLFDDLETLAIADDRLESAENWSVGPGKLKRTVSTVKRKCEAKDDWFWMDITGGHVCQGPETVVEVTPFGSQVVQLRGRYKNTGVYEREKRRLVEGFGEPESVPNHPNASGWTIEDHYIRLDLLPDGDPYLIVSATDAGKDFGESRGRVAPPPEFRDPPPPETPDLPDAGQLDAGQQ